MEKEIFFKKDKNLPTEPLKAEDSFSAIDRAVCR